MKNKDQKIRFFYIFSLGSTIGVFITVSLVIFLLFGFWLDKKFQSFPLFFLLSMLLGMISIIFELKKIILPFLEKGHR